MADEQRETKRIPFEEDIRILSPQRIPGKAADIGAGGIGVILPLGLAVGASVEMEIFSGHAITYGTVRWSRTSEEGFRIGIQFRVEDWSVIELVLALRGQEG